MSSNDAGPLTEIDGMLDPLVKEADELREAVQRLLGNERQASAGRRRTRASTGSSARRGRPRAPRGQTRDAMRRGRVAVDPSTIVPGPTDGDGCRRPAWPVRRPDRAVQADAVDSATVSDAYVGGTNALAGRGLARRRPRARDLGGLVLTGFGWSPRESEDASRAMHSLGRFGCGAGAVRRCARWLALWWGGILMFAGVALG